MKITIKPKKIIFKNVDLSGQICRETMYKVLEINAFVTDPSVIERFKLFVDSLNNVIGRNVGIQFDTFLKDDESRKETWFWWEW